MSIKNMNDIAAMFEGMRFRKKIIGGVDEADVWRQLENLQRVYQLVYDEQAAYYQALIDERDQSIRRVKGCKSGGDADG